MEITTFVDLGNKSKKCDFLAAAGALYYILVAFIKSAASAASPEGFFQAVIKSAASTASPATTNAENIC